MFGGPAFTFGYAEHVELLRAAGAEVAVVDPLRDEALPAGTAALVLPGGFPEEHVAELGANAPLRAAVAALARSGAPVHAECGGLLYLCEELDGAPMCGVLPARGGMTERLTLGYRDAVALADSSLFTAGERVTGHEFHRCAVRPRPGADPVPAAWRWRGGDPEGCISRRRARLLPAHPSGRPAGRGTRFVAAAIARRSRPPAELLCGRSPNGEVVVRIGLVLGAGGILGSAWTTGMLAGLAAGLDRPLAELDLVLGTSAGSVLGAALRCGLGVEELLAYQQGELLVPPPDPQSGPELPGLAEIDREAGDGLPRLPLPWIGSPRMLLAAAGQPMRINPVIAASALLPGRA